MNKKENNLCPDISDKNKNIKYIDSDLIHTSKFYTKDEIQYFRMEMKNWLNDHERQKIEIENFFKKHNKNILKK